MTRERVAELRALADAATPGPWIHDFFNAKIESRTPDWRWVAHDVDKEDIALIVEIRNALPELLDAMERALALCEAPCSLPKNSPEYEAWTNAQAHFRAAVEGTI